MASQGRTLELVQCQVSARTQWHFLVLRDSGRVAVGECSDSGDLTSLQSTLAVVTDRMRGADLLGDQAALVEELAHEIRSGDPAQAFVTATLLGGLEQMLCDHAAQDAGVPVWKWLGIPEPTAIATYANINRMQGGRQPADVARQAETAVAAGFRGIKCAPFDVHDSELPLAEIGLQRLRAVRAAIGPDIDLMVDCHAKLPLAEALALLPALEDLGVSWLEDVVTIDDVAGLVELRGSTDLRIAGGEFMFDPADAVEAVRRGVVDILMPDVKHAGGITRVLDIARAFPDIEISAHNPSGPVATAASAQLFAASVHSSVLEFQFGETPWRSDLVMGAEQFVDGHLQVSGRPGLGVELDFSHPSLTTIHSTTV